MKAPKKIYISTLNDGDNHYYINKTDDPADKKYEVEYIHTDAFIKKACEFFDEHLWEYINVKNANCDTFVNIDGDKLKKDFENYIKGESEL